MVNGFQRVEVFAPEDIETPDVPSWEDKREEAVSRGVTDYIQQQIDADFIETLISEHDELALPDEGDRPTVQATRDDVHAAVLNELADQPADSWTEINDAIIEELEQEVTTAQAEFAEQVREAVCEHLDESDLITVNRRDS